MFNESSAGRVNGASGAVIVPGAAGVEGNGGPGHHSPTPGPSSRLNELKRERAVLLRKLSRLQEVRLELERPAIELRDLAIESEHCERKARAALQEWVIGDCSGPRPTNAAAAGLRKRHEQATAAAQANAVPISELEVQMAATRGQIKALEDQIAAEAVAVLAAEHATAQADVRELADQLSVKLAHVAGLRAFAISRGTPAFLRLAEKLSDQKPLPPIVSSWAEAEIAGQQWAKRFAELVG